MAVILGYQSIFGQTVGEIGVVDSFLGHGPWEGWNGQWLTLVRGGEGFELQEVTVSSTRDDKPVCGDVGFIVDTPVAALGGLLLRGFPTIKAGRVVTAFDDRKFLGLGEWLDVSLGGDAHWGLQAFGTVRPELKAGNADVRYTDYQLWMTGGGRRAVVFSLPGLDSDGLPEILWVGDLDGDRVPDIFADVRTHYNAHHYVLFLSSLARTGQLVPEAASVDSHGC